MILDNEFSRDPRVKNEVFSLIKAGFRVSVLCYSYGNKPLFENYYGARIIRFKVNKKFIKKIKGLNNTFFNIFPMIWSRKIKNFILYENITHLHVHDLWMLQSALWANKAFKLPIVADLHENFVHALGQYKYSTTFPGSLLISQKKWEKDEITWLNQVDIIIVVIEEAKDRLISLGIPENKIRLVSNYVRISEFTSDIKELTFELQHKNSQFFTVTYTGGFGRHRGLNILLDSIPIIVENIPNLKVILVGGGSIEKELKDKSKKLNIEEYVDFPGYLPPEELPSYINASDICIIPHLKSGHTDNTIPHKLFQYMILQKLVIGSDCNPIKRIIYETKAGIVYKNDSPIELAKAVIKAYYMDRAKIGLNGKNAVVTKYNWASTVKTLLEIYDYKNL